MENKLQLRPLGKEDLEFIYKMQTNPDVMDYWFSEPYTTMEKLKKFHEKEQENESNRHFILYHGDEKVGYLALYSISHRHRHAEFAIMIDPDQQGKGFAAVATRLMVDYGFNQLNLRKISLEVIVDNEKAIHIYEKVGFQTEGQLKQHYFVNGSYRDALYMSVFQEEYRNKQ